MQKPFPFKFSVSPLVFSASTFAFKCPLSAHWFLDFLTRLAECQWILRSEGCSSSGAGCKAERGDRQTATAAQGGTFVLYTFYCCIVALHPGESCLLILFNKGFSGSSQALPFLRKTAPGPDLLLRLIYGSNYTQAGKAKASQPRRSRIAWPWECNKGGGRGWEWPWGPGGHKLHATAAPPVIVTKQWRFGGPGIVTTTWKYVWSACYFVTVFNYLNMQFWKVISSGCSFSYYRCVFFYKQ